MSEFYQALARYYDRIFPVDTDAVGFLRKFLPLKGPILDIGCATGGLAIALASKGYDVTGIDLDELMIGIARKKAEADRGIVKFWSLDMMKLGTVFRTGSFTAAYCFGNTLPHLSSLVQVEEFLLVVKKILVPGGKLAVQILNYERILKDRPESLPRIERPEVTFDRKYDYQDNGKILFTGVITPLESGKAASLPVGSPASSSTELLPIRKTAFLNLLSNSGYAPVKALSGYSLNPATADDFHIVYLAQVPQ